jgi:hypothetical protein
MLHLRILNRASRRILESNWLTLTSFRKDVMEFWCFEVLIDSKGQEINRLWVPSDTNDRIFFKEPPRISLLAPNGFWVQEPTCGFHTRTFSLKSGDCISAVECVGLNIFHLIKYLIIRHSQKRKLLSKQKLFLEGRKIRKMKGNN